VKAAEIAVAAAERELAPFNQAGANVDAKWLERARGAVEAAKAQLDIRKAELNEVAVKLKHAKRRADAAAPAAPADKLGRDVQLQLLAGLAAAAAAQEKAAKAQLDQAKAERDRAKRLLAAMAITKADYDTAVAHENAAAANVRQAEAAAAALRGALDVLKKAGGGGASDRKQLEADVDRAEAALKLKRAEVEKAKAALQEAKATVERLEDLARRGIVARADFDAARARVAETEANIQAAEAEASVAEVTLKRAKQRLDGAAK